MRCRTGTRTVGIDHVLYGSAAPPLTSLKPRAIKLVEDLGLPPADEEKVFWRNAAKLLKLSEADVRAHAPQAAAAL